MISKMSGFGKEVPPQQEHVIVYFIQKGFTKEEAFGFFIFYKERCWKGKRNRHLSNWKAAAWRWMLLFDTENNDLNR